MFIVNVVENAPTLLAHQAEGPKLISKKFHQLNHLLEEYNHLFEPPTGLPPNKVIEHCINYLIELKIGSSPFQ